MSPNRGFSIQTGATFMSTLRLRLADMVAQAQTINDQRTMVALMADRSKPPYNYVRRRGVYIFLQFLSKRRLLKLWRKQGKRKNATSNISTDFQQSKLEKETR